MKDAPSCQRWRKDLDNGDGNQNCVLSTLKQRYNPVRRYTVRYHRPHLQRSGHKLTRFPEVLPESEHCDKYKTMLNQYPVSTSGSAGTRANSVPAQVTAKGAQPEVQSADKGDSTCKVFRLRLAHLP